MEIIYRLQEALKSPLGDLLIFLVLLTLTLSFFYLYFWARFSNNKNLVLKHHFAFKKMEKNVSEVTFLESGTGDFFGKKQMVELAGGRSVMSTLFYPELNTEKTITRFKQFHLSLKASHCLTLLKQQQHFKSEFVLSLDPLSNKKMGSHQVFLDQFIQQNMMTAADKEFFLLDLAHTLSELHEHKTEAQETLYHGFLLPNRIVLHLDMVKRIQQTDLLDNGLAFSLGSDLFKQWYQKIASHKLNIDPLVQQTLKKYAFILAPEQRNTSMHLSVSEACDFYAFGALSLYLFNEECLDEISNEHFSACPASWVPFLKECLASNPQERPKNFLELKEYTSHPEVTIQHLGDEMGIDPSLHQLGDLADQEIKPLFDHIQKMKNHEAHFSNQWHLGYQAIRTKEWTEALGIFNQMMKEDPLVFNAHLGLALTYFKKGEQEKAKYHYLQAKKIDGKKISSFHRLIAFEV